MIGDDWGNLGALHCLAGWLLDRPNPGPISRAITESNYQLRQLSLGRPALKRPSDYCQNQGRQFYEYQRTGAAFGLSVEYRHRKRGCPFFPAQTGATQGIKYLGFTWVSDLVKLLFFDACCLSK